MNVGTKNRPLVVVWRITDFCSLTCGFCGYSREMSFSRRTADVLEVLRFAELLAEFQSATGRDVLISWLGGEPLSWLEIERVSQILAGKFRLSLGVTTNGLPLDSSAIRRLLAHHFAQLTISIDGLAEMHDRLRAKPGLFARIKRNIQLLRDEAPPGKLTIRINTVLMRENIDHFAELCDELGAWRIDEITFNQLGGIERPEFHREHHLLPQQVSKFARELPEIRRRVAARGLKICGSPRYVERIVATTNHVKLPIDHCGPGEDFLFIDSQGRVSPCSFTNENYGISLAQLRTLADFLSLPAKFQAARRTQRALACDDCHATAVFDKFEPTLR